MELRQELLFKASKGPKLELTLPEKEGDDDKLTLGLKGQFNKTLAESLGVGWMFAAETTAHSGLKDGNLSGDIAFSDVELKLKGAHGELDTFYPEKVHSYRVYSAGAGSLGIQCKIDITGDFNVLLEFFRKHMVDGFDFIIRSRQQELFDGGTRVDMSADVEPSDPPEVDRSHENAPKGGRRGRPKKVQDISQPVLVAAPEVDNAEWDKHFDEKHAEAVPEPEEALIQ